MSFVVPRKFTFSFETDFANIDDKNSPTAIDIEFLVLSQGAISRMGEAWRAANPNPPDDAPEQAKHEHSVGFSKHVYTQSITKAVHRTDGEIHHERYGELIDDIYEWGADVALQAEYTQKLVTSASFVDTAFLAKGFASQKTAAT